MAINMVGTSKSGRLAFRNIVRVNRDFGAQAASVTTENAVVPIAGSLFQPEDLLFSNRSIAVGQDAGLFYSHSRIGNVAGSASMFIGLANSTLAGVDPAAVDYVSGSFRTAFNRRPPTGPYNLAFAGVVSVDSAIIAANVSVFTNAIVLPEPVVVAFASPRAALPAGLAFDDITSAFTLGTPNATLQIGMHNLTGVGIDPAAQLFDIVAFRPFNPALDSIANAVTQGRVSPSGPPLWRKQAGVVIDHGAIAAGAVVEATAALNLPGRNVAPLATAAGGIAGPVAVVNPTAALPAGLAISHARISALNTLSVGLANVSAAPIDPAAITYDAMVITPN